MTKPVIDFKKEPLRWICSEAFYGAKSLSPGLYHAERYDKPLACLLGGAGGVGVAELGKHIVHPDIIEPILTALGSSASLEEVISHCLTFTLGAAITPFVVAPKKMSEWIREHSTYASGVAGVMIGAVGTGLAELYMF